MIIPALNTDSLLVKGVSQPWLSPLCNDSTTAMLSSWRQAQDSALYHGSGFWFQDVLQYFIERDPFGIERHEGMIRPYTMMSETFLMLLLLFEIMLIAYLVKSGLKLISQYTRIPFTSVELSASHLEAGTGFHFNKFLWILSIVIFGLMGHVLVSVQDEQARITLDSTLIVWLLAYTFAYFLLRGGLYRLVGFVFFQPMKTDKWIINNKTILFTYAMVLTPVLIGAEIGAFADRNFILIYTIATLLLAKIWMLFRTIRIFSVGFADILYLILYLCTLEIMPILLYYKGLFLILN